MPPGSVIFSDSATSISNATRRFGTSSRATPWASSRERCASGSKLHLASCAECTLEARQLVRAYRRRCTLLVADRAAVIAQGADAQRTPFTSCAGGGPVARSMAAASPGWSAGGWRRGRCGARPGRPARAVAATTARLVEERGEAAEANIARLTRKAPRLRGRRILRSRFSPRGDMRRIDLQGSMPLATRRPRLPERNEGLADRRRSPAVTAARAAVSGVVDRRGSAGPRKRRIDRRPIRPRHADRAAARRRNQPIDHRCGDRRTCRRPAGTERRQASRRLNVASGSKPWCTFEAHCRTTSASSKSRPRRSKRRR